MKKFKILIYATMQLAFPSCRKQFDQPPLAVLAEGEKISLSMVRARVPAQPSAYRFTGDTSLYCTVTADETSGTFYRRIFIVDDEGAAMAVNLLTSGGIYTGDRLRISLNGVNVTHANEFFSLDSVTREKNIIKVSSGNRIVPKTTTMTSLLSSLSTVDLQSQLVELNNVEFNYAHRNVPLGDAIGKTTKDLTLTDCQSNTITVAVSGFANFASKLSPSGNGKIAGIVTRYNNMIELLPRYYSDLSMTAPPCTGSATTLSSTFSIGTPVSELNENFNSASDQADLALPGWINFCETGKTKWKGNLKAGIYKAGKITAFGAGQAITSWLISPPIVYKPNLELSFKTGAEYFKTGHTEPIMALVCTNLDGTNMKTANWTPIANAVYISNTDGSYSGAGGLKSSGVIHLKDLPLLSGYSGTFFIAFKYQGEPGFDTNIYVDDILVK